MAKIKDLTQGSLTRHLYQLALPIMGSSFVQMAYNFTDMAWLGRLGSEAVASVGTTSVFLWIANSIAYFNKTGSEVTLGHCIGRDDHEGTRSFASHNTTMSLLLGFIVSLSYFLFAPSLIDLYQLETNVRENALSYFYISLIGLPAAFLISTLFGIYTATGNSRIPFFVLTIGLICNMVLDPLLIFSFGWGIKGAAWATVASEYLSLTIFLWRLKIVDRLLDNFPLFIRLHLPYVWRITKIGFPAATLNVLFALVSIYMGRLASTVGGHVGVAVLTTGGQLEALTWNTSQGATTALSTIVAQNYSAGILPRVYRAYRIALMFTLGIGLLGMLYFYFGGESLFALVVPDLDTYRAGGEYLRISAYSQIFMMLEITTQGLFYGMGRSYLPASISIVGNALRIPLAIYLVGWGWGLSAIWWAISLSAIFKGVLALFLFTYVYYRQKRIKSLAQA